MSLPYFPMYPTDFEAKTSHLTLAEDGAFNRLLRLCWMSPECSLPDDHSWIMRRMRCCEDEFNAVVLVVLNEFFHVEKGRVFNKRLKEEWVAAHEAHKKRKNAGKRGAAAKLLKTLETQSSNANTMLKQPEPEPELEDTNVSTPLSPFEILSKIAGAKAAQNFLDHRKEIKKPLTARSAAAMVKKLQGHHDPPAVLNESVANGWQGIFPDKIKPKFSTIQGGQNGQPNSKAAERSAAFITGAKSAS